MKFLSIASLTLILALSGCGSPETDPVEEISKIDDFRTCVKTWLEDRGYNWVEGSFFEYQAKKACLEVLGK